MGKIGTAKDRGKECIHCHSGIEEMDENHRFECIYCHFPLNRGGDKGGIHLNVVKNPSDPNYWDVACGRCHQTEIGNLKKSLHFTLDGIIYQSLSLWGGQSEGEDLILGGLGRRFLEDNCTGCHISKGSNEKGFYRSTGCAACHMEYGEEGRYEGGDKGLRSSKKVRARGHRFKRPIEDRSCLSCHRKNHVGSDYLGLFERDTTASFELSEFRGDKYRDYHRLREDVHHERGMRCTDCHKKSDVMGDGRSYSYALQDSKVRCNDCHKNLDSLPHIIPKHKRLHCTACHSQWVFGDFGLSVMAKELSDGRAEWRMGYRFRRWDWIPLGVDQQGFIRPLRPKYQYLISYIDSEGRVVLDSYVPQRKSSGEKGWGFLPYTPHNVQRGRVCYSCHGNRMASGEGIEEELSFDTVLTRVDGVLSPHRKLNKQEQEMLMKPSKEFERWRSKYLLQTPGKGSR